MFQFKQTNLFLSLAFLLVWSSCTEPVDSNDVLRRRKKMEKQDRIDLAMEQEFMMTRDPALNRVPRERL
ncbi:MAG TPA: hypothetical protein VD794_02945, partial [Flavisolibacter sp.]|nr:hypothetical protein [Flavisolibacter sp.]